MNAKPIRLQIVERLLRSMLGLALVAGVAFALTDGGAIPVAELVAVLG
jgi:hypothetical protein